MNLELVIDGVRVRARDGQTVLCAALEAGLYIPSLCSHPDLPPQKDSPAASQVWVGSHCVSHVPHADQSSGCGLCVVEVEGLGRVASCETVARDGMIVASDVPSVKSHRRQRMSSILAHHPHACLTCAQREGCTREPCSMNVPQRERCCSLLGHCELQDLAEYVGIDPATPRYVVPSWGPARHEPLFNRDPSLCIACGRCARACHGREVSALGWVRDASGRVWVGPLAETPVDAGCRLCGSCVEVCPTGALMDRGVKPSERLDALVPCRSACPSGTDVPRYVWLVAQGRFEEASRVVAERAPLVEVLGQICFHPCETRCRRNEVNQAPVSICRIKREAGRLGASDWTRHLPTPFADTSKRVAVVGAGPAGLMACHVLRLLGHDVTLFEAREAIGGMLRYGIPAFRLSREVVRRETHAMVEGIRVQTGARVGRNGLSLSALRETHDAVILAVGAGESATLDVPGEGLEGVASGLAFLGELAGGLVGDRMHDGKTVVVVGGGNVAIDCARAALRLGAARVDLVCLESAQEMPAYPHEVAQAVAEGLRIHPRWGIVSFEGQGRVCGVKLKRCTQVFNENRVFSPKFELTDTWALAADAVLVAIGQRAAPWVSDACRPGIFLAGDCLTGAKSVVEAIASGRRAALDADRSLGGPGELTLCLGPVETSMVLGKVDGFVSLGRLEPRPSEPIHGRPLFEVPGGLGEQGARDEAARCLRCDLRLRYHRPQRPAPKQKRFPSNDSSLCEVPHDEGVLRFYDEAGDVVEIVGAADMHREAQARVGQPRAHGFDFERCAMYTQRQNELLSQYMDGHGRMPPGVRKEDDLDDLF